MKSEALLVFLILLLGLVLCYFLGDDNCMKEGLTENRTYTNKNRTHSGASSSSSAKYDNYNHYNGNSNELSSGSTFYGKNGTTAVVVGNNDGSQSLQITLPGSSEPLTFSVKQNSNIESYTNYYGNGNATIYYGPNNSKATVVTTNDNQKAIKVTTSNGTYYYNVSGTTDSSTQYYGSTGTQIQEGPYSTSYQGPYGGTAGSVTGPRDNTAYYAEGPGGNVVAGTRNDYHLKNQYYGPNGGSIGSVTGPAGNTADYAQGPAGNTVAGTSNDDYYNSLSHGIPRSQIPPGQEDLYILKSQVVPPVCPACPTSSACPRQEPCPPCPACARCPEPSFECKKVPNYNAINNKYLPAPVLNDFSSFGM